MRESLAIKAIQRENNIRLLTTVSIINAIIHTGNMIGAAVSGGSSSSDSGEALKKTLENLEKSLMPQSREHLEKRSKEVKRILEEETSRGPFKVKAVAKDKSKSKRIRLGNSSGDRNVR